jgi:hypothetical protein
MVDPPPLHHPVPGPPRTVFRYDRRTPFAAGQRRTTTFAARPGEPVAAPCGGRVGFVGRTPRDRGVGLRCGGWAVTVLGVAARGGRGDAVAAGRALGRATGGTVSLSLRPVGDRFGYVDPQRWLVARRPVAPLGPAPRSPSAPRRVPAPRPPRTVPAGRTPGLLPRPQAVRPRTTGDRAPVTVPWPVAVGAGLALLGRPALRRRRRPLDGQAEVTTRCGSVPSIGNGLLRHDPDLLRQRRATPRARVLDDRR